MDIGEVAKETGFAPSTLRYYEEKGLIKSVGRNGLRRVFDPSVVDRLALIALGQSAGFSLIEIDAMFTVDGPQIDRNQLMKKADELDKKIKQLSAMRDGLRHAAACPESSHFECPNFLRRKDFALKDQKRRRK